MHPRRQRRSGMRNALGTLLLLLLVPACKSDKPPAAQAATLPARADDSAARTIVPPGWAHPVPAGGTLAPAGPASPPPRSARGRPGRGLARLPAGTTPQLTEVTT